MAFKIDKKTAELMYQHQNGYIPKGIDGAAQLEQYMGMIDDAPEKWASTYKHVTGKEMPLSKSKPDVKIDPKIIKKYVIAKFGKISADTMTNHLEFYKANPSAYTNIIKYLENLDKLKAAAPAKATYKVDPVHVKDWLSNVYLTSDGELDDSTFDYWMDKLSTNPKAYAQMLYAIGVSLPPTVASAVASSKGDLNDAVFKTVSSAGKKKVAKAAKPAAIPKFKVSSNLVTIWMKDVLSPGSYPSANDVMEWITKFKDNPAGYAKILRASGFDIPEDVQAAVAATKGNKTMPNVAAPLVVAPTKALTLSQQIKAIPVTVPGPSVVYNIDDPEAIELFQTAKDLLRKANKNKDYGTEYSKALTVIRDKVEDSTNGVEYLKRVVKTLDPTWKQWDPKQKVKPGGMHGLPVPTGKLSPTAQSLTASPDAEAKAAALEIKIKEYTAEIERLKKLQKTADAAKAKASKEKENLAGMDPKLLQYFTYIEQNCSEFLKSAQAADKFLYRGQRDTKLPVFVGRPRADREPKDSSVEAQKLADKCLTIMGFKALRSNSIFTSADYNQADNYGTVYAIFPKNGFDFTWSPKHDDLVIHSTGELTGHDDDDEEPYYDWNYVIEDFTDIKGNVTLGDIESWVAEHIAYTKAEAVAKVVAKAPEFIAMRNALKEWYKLNGDEKTDKIATILVSTASAMIAFDDLKLVKGWLSAPYRKKLEKYLKEANNILSKVAGPKAGDKEKVLAAKVIKHMGFTKDNLVAALKSEHEICVLGEYVAVNATTYKKELRRYFLESTPKGVKKGKQAPADDEDDSY